MSSLLERLRAPAVDRDALRDAISLVTSTAQALARLRKIVPPGGGPRWTIEDVEDLVGEFFSVPGRIVDLALGAKDDSHFTARIEKALKRVASDTFRKTPLGVLHRRIERRMSVRADVVDVAPDHWALQPHADEPHWGGGPAPLEAAAATVAIADPVPQAFDSDKRPPATDTVSLDAVCSAVLVAAACPVEQPLVVRVVSTRILPGDVQMPAGEEEEEDAERLEEQAADPWAHQGPGAALAAAIWAELDDDERQLLPELDQPGRVLAAEGALGLQKSAIEERLKKLKGKLAPLLEGFDDAVDAMRALLERHLAWSAARTTGHDSEVEP